MSSLEPNSSGPDPSRRVDRRVADALRAAEQELREARRSAAEIVARAHEEADQLREAARAEGRENARLEQAEWTARSIAEMMTWFEQSEARLAERARACVATLLERELAARPDGVLDLVRAATRDLRDALDLRIIAHPEDVPIIQSRTAALRDRRPAGATLRVSADAELSRGTCRVESELGVVDASRDGLMESLRRAWSARANGLPRSETQ